MSWTRRVRRGENVPSARTAWSVRRSVSARHPNFVRGASGVLRTSRWASGIRDEVTPLREGLRRIGGIAPRSDAEASDALGTTRLRGLTRAVGCVPGLRPRVRMRLPFGRPRRSRRPAGRADRHEERDQQQEREPRPVPGPFALRVGSGQRDSSLQVARGRMLHDLHSTVSPVTRSASRSSRDRHQRRIPRGTRPAPASREAPRSGCAGPEPPGR